MPNRVFLIVNTPTPASSVAQDSENFLDSVGREREFCNKIVNEFAAMSGGNFSAKVEAGVVAGSADAVSASCTATFSAVPDALETIVIAGTTITFVDGTASNNQVKRDDMPSNSVLASRLASAINNSTTAALSGLWEASASDAVVTISFKIPGIVGNQFEITETATGLALSGLTGNKPTNGVGSFPSLRTFRLGY